MSISEALNYPFKNNNLLKILPVALVYGIVLFIANFGSVGGNVVLACGGAIASLALAFFLSGYYISAMRRLQANDENLPEYDISTNIKDGFMVIIAGILYMLPVMLLMIPAIFSIIAVSPASAPVDSGGGAGMGLLLVCGAMIFGIIAAILLGAALNVGMLRFADTGESSTLFELPSNWRTVTNNFGLVGGLFGRIFVIGLISGIISFVLGIILGVMFPDQMNPNINANPTFTYWMVSAIINVAAYTISLVIGLAQVHLIYRFGLELGIGTGKAKRDEVYEF